MTPFEEELQRSRGRAYLKQHGPLTCVVLTLVVLISALAHPLDWRQILACVIAGVVFYAGAVIVERGHNGLGYFFTSSAIILAMWSMLEFGIRGAALIWVQGGGTFAAAVFGAYVFHSAVADTAED